MHICKDHKEHVNDISYIFLLYKLNIKYIIIRIYSHI
jgi:hypothetical protein